MTTYRLAKGSPGPTWTRRLSIQHVTPGGQTVWSNRLWRRSGWRMAMLWMAAAGVFLLVAWGACR